MLKAEGSLPRIGDAGKRSGGEVKREAGKREDVMGEWDPTLLAIGGGTARCGIRGRLRGGRIRAVAAPWSESRDAGEQGGLKT